MSLDNGIKIREVPDVTSADQAAVRHKAHAKNAAIFAVICAVFTAIAIYVLYAGNVGPNPLWNLSNHTLSICTIGMAGAGSGLTAIGLIIALANKVFQKQQLEIIYSSNPLKGFV